MEYRRLGTAGLRVSVLSYGTWLTFAEQADLDRAIDCLAVARDGGINYYDTADIYGGGQAEELLGTALQSLGWDRETYVLATKLFGGTRDIVNLRQTLNRKYLITGIDASLARLRTPYVDLLYCHRPDPYTPIEETVWAMSDIVAAGKALYWGTSGWSVPELRAALDVADRCGLRAPVVEQPEYNLLARKQVEQAFPKAGLQLGLATHSPLAGGLLSAKYLAGIPKGSRASLPSLAWYRETLSDPRPQKQVRDLAELARSINVTPAQLAIAWCTRRASVSTVILGASQPAQLQENLAAIHVAGWLSDEIFARLESLFPQPH
jgi:voltage-dependent potassium channel beta subunit